MILLNAVECELLSKALLWALCFEQEVFVHFHPLMQNNLILTGEMLIQLHCCLLLQYYSAEKYKNLSQIVHLKMKNYSSSCCSGQKEMFLE